MHHAFALLVTLLPLLAQASGSRAPPPALRHKRMAEHVRHLPANDPHLPRAIPARSNAGHAEAHEAMKRNVNKRQSSCRVRDASSALTSALSTATGSFASPTASGSFTAGSASWSASSTDSWSASSTDSEAWSSSSSSDNWSASTTSSSPAWTASSTSSSWTTSSSSVGGADLSISVSGLLSITDNTCGSCDSSSSAPNGQESWLNCGVDADGWTPPMVTIDQLIAADLDDSGPFAPCSAYIDKFNQYGAANNIHPIMLASFAMQESTCNPSATGGNKEAGLMQLAQANCDGAPNGNCYDVDFNINKAAQYFSGVLSSCNNNVICAVGTYNGWTDGMTIASATAAKDQGDCSGQNNLDYLHQYFNGWMQNRNGYDIGTYWNLKSC